MEQIELQFDFKNTNAGKLYFTNPEKIYLTYKLSEVDHLLTKIEEEVQKGYYAAGYISYEATYALYNINKPLNQHMPLVWMGIFKHPSKIKKRKTENYTVSNWEMQVSKVSYTEKIEQIFQYIKKGIIDQVNYTVPFQANFNGDAYAYYEQLKLAQDTKFSAFLNLGNFSVLSVSPELFFQVQDSTVTVRPMKGTIHRGKTYDEDKKLAQWLNHSKKNRLENDIITDLMKDELTNIATDIKVTNRYDVEKYETVYQMTSTISGNIKEGITAIKLLKTIFPCGSISGVPKKETIELISQLEPTPREVYTGAIGFLTPNGEATFNVPIRTVMIDKLRGIAQYHAGGAITKHSNADEEYKEVLTKTKILSNKRVPFQLLETFGLYDGEYVVFEEHLNRLTNSATYFNFHIDTKKLHTTLLEIAEKHSSGNWRVRLLAHKNGDIETEVSPLLQTKQMKVKLAEKPINSQDIFLYHKTTNRKMYAKHFEGVDQDISDVLLWNEREEITEFTIGNIVVELNGELLTPPVSSGLLPGTYRERLLKERKIKEKIITREDLAFCSSIWLINSVRKWVKVKLKSAN